jgi:hypothetical protein
MMHSPDDLRRLTRIYAAATGLQPSTISRRALGPQNGKSLPRLLAGDGLRSRTIELLSVWYVQNWPRKAEWPKGVRRYFRGGELAKMPVTEKEVVGEGGA